LIANYFYKTLLIRALSAILLIVLAFLSNLIGSYFFLLSIILVFFILLYEYYQLFSLKKLTYSFFFSNFLTFISFLLIFYNFYLLIVFPIILNFIIILSLEKKKWLPYIFSVIYLAFPLYILVYLNNIVDNGKLFILWSFVIVWSSDISAFLFGKTLKGPKLFPRISPNKTWSGFLCSIFFSVIASIIFVNFFPLANLFFASLVGLLVGLACSAGDLFESWLKRINIKKDTSNLIPGHGGLLDRLDGFLFGIIIVFIMTLIRG
jgi:phosphatidate cytidylyltransferase